jgi:uracil-DNA glycosylase
VSLNYLAEDWEILDPYWQNFFSSTCWDELVNIDSQLAQITQHATIYPPKKSIFRALNQLTPTMTKVVILGQDPYHGENEANGLAFAVNNNIKFPPSLRNIFKELLLEYNPLLEYATPSPTLDNWKSQGVLLLNSTLTVIKDQAASLSAIGWQHITDLIIKHISTNAPHCVFMLWGNHARSKKTLINPQQHLILESVHPSPLSAHRGFFGCNHFSDTNDFLVANNHTPINWLE